MAKHGDVRYLLGNNALTTRSNLARWARGSNKPSPNCKFCSEEETSLHIFMCRRFRNLRRAFFQTFASLIEPGTSFESLIFCGSKSPIVQGFMVEALHRMWSARCELQFDNICTKSNIIYARILRNLKMCILASPKASNFDCPLFDSTKRCFSF